MASRAKGRSREPELPHLKGSMPPSIGHMELLAWMQRADFSEHIQGCKSPGDPLNSSHFDAPNTKSAPTGYRRAPNIISHHYKQQLSAKASIVPKPRRGTSRCRRRGRLGSWVPAFGDAGLGRLGEWRPPGPSCFRFCFSVFFAPMRDCRPSG